MSVDRSAIVELERMFRKLKGEIRDDVLEQVNARLSNIIRGGLVRGDRISNLPSTSHPLWSSTHTDVDATDIPANGDFIMWDGSAGKWIAAPAAGGSAVFTGASVYHNADQSVPDATETVLSFNSEHFDTDGFHDTSTNNSRLTIPSGLGGKYIVFAQVRFAPDAQGNRICEILKNGSDVIASDRSSVTASTATMDMPIARLVELSAGDYIEVRVLHGAGNALNMTAVSGLAPEFGLVKVG